MKNSWSREQLANGLVAAILVAAAVAVAVFQQAVGVALVDTHDGYRAIGTLHGFRDALAQGDLLPRWYAAGNGGLGSPGFLFYPLGAYAIPALAGMLWPGMSDAGAIGLACTLFRIVSLLSCAAWLRHRNGTATALAGGAIYALMPYVAHIDPEMRLAFAETAAGALLPLAFLAAALGSGRIARTVFLVAPVTACLALIHPPTAIIAGGLTAAYCLFSAGSWRNAACGTLAVAAGAAVGFGLAAIFLLPAGMLQPAVQFWTMELPGYLPENNFLFAALLPPPGFFTQLHGAVLLSLIAALLGWHRCRQAGVPGQRGLLPTLATAFILMTPLSRLAWEYLPLLGRVQFPFRIAFPFSALAAAALAPALPSFPRRWVIAAVLAWTALLGAAAWQDRDPRPNEVRTAEALDSGRSLPPEHLPSTAPRYWQDLRDGGPDVLLEAGKRASGCPGHHGLPLTQDGARITVLLQGCDGKVVLPHFWFPGWAGPETLPQPVADPASGLILVDVPPGMDRLELHRTGLAEDRDGRQVTLAASGLWLLSGLAAFARFHRCLPSMRGVAAKPWKPRLRWPTR
jgi:hypothetical protein